MDFLRKIRWTLWEKWDKFFWRKKWDGLCEKNEMDFMKKKMRWTFLEIWVGLYGKNRWTLCCHRFSKRCESQRLVTNRNGLDYKWTDGYHCSFPDVFHFNDNYDDNEYSAHCDDWRHLRQSDAGTVPHPDGSWGRDGRHRLLRHRRTLELSTQSPLDCSVNNLAVCSTLHMVAQSLWMTHNTEQLNPQWAEHCSGLTPQWREHCGFAGPQWVTK